MKRTRLESIIEGCYNIFYMIDIIKNIFKIGDKIILTCTDKSKIEGTIQEIADDVILIKEKNNIIKGVKSTMIEYFEQPVTVSEKKNETSVSGKHDLKIIDKIPLETLLQKDPRLKKRFPNLAKDKEVKITQQVDAVSAKQDTTYY